MIRTASLALVIAACFLAAVSAHAAQQSAAEGLFQDGARVDSLLRAITPDQLEAFRRSAAREGKPRNWYDLGAALLLTGDWEGAVEPLQRATRAPDGRVDEPSAYNLGVAYGLGGRPGPGGVDGGVEARRGALVQAREAFRAVLRANPAAEDARWNLEVIDTWLEQIGGAGGGEGGGGGSEGGNDTMTQAQADQLLDAAAAEERRVQEDRLERNRSRDPVADRNW